MLDLGLVFRVYSEQDERGCSGPLWLRRGPQPSSGSIT